MGVRPNEYELYNNGNDWCYDGTIETNKIKKLEKNNKILLKEISILKMENSDLRDKYGQELQRNIELSQIVEFSKKNSEPDE